MEITKSPKRLFVSSAQESSRMFKASWMELLSKVHFLMPLVIYLPVIVWCFYQTGFNIFFLIRFFLGLFIWSFTEYILHRFVFHWTPPGKLGARIHFIFHGVHHDFPNDRLRLVMPPSVSIPLALLFFYGFKFTLGISLVYPFFAGFIFGYLIYDMMHYSIHHLNWRNPVWEKIKQQHMRHHFMEPEKGYGVSNPFWDYIFNTTFNRNALHK